jgi:hypothetical protein
MNANEPPGHTNERQRVSHARGAGISGVPASVRAEWSGPDLAAQWRERAGVQGSPAIKRSVGGSGGAKPPGQR